MKISTADYDVHNVMEDVAQQAIERVLGEDSSACSCQMCRDDMQSYMLNQLQPHYYPGQPGQDFKIPELEKLEGDLFNRVMVECYKSVQKVKKSPRHDHTRSPVHNYAANMVISALQDILTREKLQLGRLELSELMALVLNDLKPKYTTTPKGDVFIRTAEMDPAFLARLYTSIYNALKELRVLQSHA